MLRLNWKDHDFGAHAIHDTLRAVVEQDRRGCHWRVTYNGDLVAKGTSTTVPAAKHAAEAALLRCWLEPIATHILPLFPEVSHAR